MTKELHDIKELYTMNIHDILRIDDATEITRVPGGWIYRYFQLGQTMMPDGKWDEDYEVSSVFVPFYLPEGDEKC